MRGRSSGHLSIEVKLFWIPNKPDGRRDNQNQLMQHIQSRMIPSSCVCDFITSSISVQQAGSGRLGTFCRALSGVRRPLYITMFSTAYIYVRTEHSQEHRTHSLTCVTIFTALRALFYGEVFVLYFINTLYRHTHIVYVFVFEVVRPVYERLVSLDLYRH